MALFMQKAMTNQWIEGYLINFQKHIHIRSHTMAVMSKLNNKTLTFPPQLCLCFFPCWRVFDPHCSEKNMVLFKGWNKLWTCRFNQQLEEKKSKSTYHATSLQCKKKQTVATEFFGCPSLSGGCIFWPRRHHRQQGKHGKAGSREVNGMGTSKRNTMGMGPKFNGPRAFGHSSS